MFSQSVGSLRRLVTRAAALQRKIEALIVLAKSKMARKQ